MKDKLLNFLLIFLTIFLILSFFDDSSKTQNDTSFFIKSQEDSYTLPASPKVNLQNNTSKEIKLNTCDLKIKSISGNIEITDKNFCRDITIAAGKNYLVDYANYFKQFELTGDYIVDLKLGEKDYTTRFAVETKGFFNKFFTFFFYAPFYNLIAFILTLTSYSLFWAIIIVTIIIRLILLQPQHKMMVSQAKMQAIQPKIKEIQEKYKGNHQMLGMELMKLYKEEKVNPMGSCLPLLIQMPILIVVYHILISIQDPVNTYYIYSFLQNFSIASIQTKFYFIDLLSVGGIVGGVLAIVVGIVQYIQIKLSLSYNKAKEDKSAVVLEKKKGSDAYDMQSFMPDQDVMNKFMLYGMPIMVMIFTFTFYVGVGIYWGISTIFMIFQQLIVNKLVKKSSEK